MDYIIVALIIFFAGVVVGAWVVFMHEKETISALRQQCRDVEEAGRQALSELEDCKRTNAMLESIDDVPDYLRSKYVIPGQSTISYFTDSNEDFKAIYD